MHQNLKRFLVKSFFVLALLHVAYFTYGYFKFSGIQNLNIYTEFYRFKFYDDVSISHFFVTGLFLLATLILLLRNHSKEKYRGLNLLKIGAMLLLIVFLSLTFFVSYSLGMNAKLRKELPEKDFNSDKKLLNVLNPFLYPYTSYSSERLFNVKRILYPKPYPVFEVKDTVFYDANDTESFSIESNYYSIDTLKMLTSAYGKLQNTASSVSDILGIDKETFEKRIISKNTRNDSTEIVFKGREVNVDYDDNVCVFLENDTLISPISTIPYAKQQRQNAKKRYELLYSYKHDSLSNYFEKLTVLLKKYHIESQIKPKELAEDAFHYREKNQEPLNAIRNTFERNELIEKIATLNRLFYQPGFFHSSIRMIFFSVLFSVWFIGFSIFLLWNYKNRKKWND